MKRRIIIRLVAPVLATFIATASNVQAETRLAASIAELPLVGNLGIGPAMDAAVVGGRLFVIGRGKLHVADVSVPRKPILLGSLDGLGNTRQIVVDGAGETAYVSSREFGLYVVDVRDGAHPVLLNHYDTIELATGLALAGDVLFVACRQYGVELVDVSDPSQPRHLSTVQTGEAQSVTYRDGLLYAGVWGASKVVTVDVRDARAPQILSETPLDGYGDGVEVHGDRLYAATGHHSREPHSNEGDPGYGKGHGLEIFDLADPAQPAFLGRVKFPAYYSIGNDMWSVSVTNGHAFVADTHNGLFVVDVRDPTKPQIIAGHQLPTPANRDAPAYFGGLAVGDGCLYGAGGWTDLHIFEEPNWAKPIVAESGLAPKIGPRQKAIHDNVLASYQPDGQVHGVAMADSGSLAAVACGSAGVHLVRIGTSSIDLVEIIETQDFATDVYVRGDLLYICEGTGGFSIWELSDDGQASRLGGYQSTNQRVRYAVVPTGRDIALLEVNGGQLHILDVSNPASPELLKKDSWPGLFYGDQLLDALVDGRYAAAFWHASGLHWYDLGTQVPDHEGQHPEGRFNMADGLVQLDDRLLATRYGGLVWFDQDENRPFSELPIQRLPGVSLKGRPTVAEDILYVSNRFVGDIHLVDLSDRGSPVHIESYNTGGNPGTIVTTKHGYLIPNGYGGLLLMPARAQ